MRGKLVLAAVGISICWASQREPTLDASSLIELHGSYERMVRELRLSGAEAAALEQAIDVLVGDAARDLIASRELKYQSLGPKDRRLEAEILAPLDGLAYRELLSAAAATKVDEMNVVLAQLAAEEATAASDRRMLASIEVLDACYWMSVDTGASWIDLTIRNASDRRLHELFLDCRLVEQDGRAVLQSGGCRVAFEPALAPGESRSARTHLSWRTQPRASLAVEAWAIQAYGADGSLLWDMPSRLDPRWVGRVADLRSRVDDLDESLRSLGVSPPAAH
ncbi:MAG TPA: hypothetical protein VMS86_05760 [Thermoanaerobaculia bacterium]|nr:hypothetical protein [Thermoanaerobaculia bacterium]